MTTVDKALSLLDHFSNEQTEIGLSEFARLSGFDKSAALRMLSALARGGFVEQDTSTRKYRLGGALLRLARLREDAVPMAEILEPIAQKVTDATRETSHVSLYAGGRLSTIVVVPSPRSTRVYVPNGLTVPFNATASGLCWLAFSAPELAAQHLDGTLERFQAETPTDRDAIEALLEQFRAKGFSFAERTFDDDVSSVAAPIFGSSGQVLGTVSVAAVATRVTPQLTQRHGVLAAEAAMKATVALGARVPQSYRSLLTRAEAA